jgi:hypothetical protein
MEHGALPRFSVLGPSCVLQSGSYAHLLSELCLWGACLSDSVRLRAVGSGRQGLSTARSAATQRCSRRRGSRVGVAGV